VGATIVRWVTSTLENRSIVATQSGKTLQVSMTRACQQGGWVVLSPLLWSLVVNELLGELKEGSYYAAGYDDDNTILINGKFPQSQRYWEQPLDWYSSGDRINLSINPSKMVVLPFTRNRALKCLKKLTQVIPYSCPQKSNTLD
jgi:hypothetical protein